MMKAWTIVVAFALVSACGGADPSSKPAAAPVAQTKPDPLPSWNDSASKKAIVDFVGRVTREGGPDFVPEPNASPRSTTTARSGRNSRSTSRLRLPLTASGQWPRSIREWKQKQPFKGILEGDMKAVAAAGEKGLLEVIGATHVRQYDRRVRGHRRRMDSEAPTIPSSSGPIRTSSTSRCWRCSPI